MILMLWENSANFPRNWKLIWLNNLAKFHIISLYDISTIIYNFIFQFQFFIFLYFILIPVCIVQDNNKQKHNFPSNGPLSNRILYLQQPLWSHIMKVIDDTTKQD